MRTILPVTNMGQCATSPCLMQVCHTVIVMAQVYATPAMCPGPPTLLLLGQPHKFHAGLISFSTRRCHSTRMPSPSVVLIVMAIAALPQTATHAVSMSENATGCGSRMSGASVIRSVETEQSTDKCGVPSKTYSDPVTSPCDQLTCLIAVGAAALGIHMSLAIGVNAMTTAAMALKFNHSFATAQMAVPWETKNVPSLPSRHSLRAHAFRLGKRLGRSSARRVLLKKAK
mmetsp:Transcript_1393/g.3176  ORF Transcript_1393/g.3176 Transcript_1393/m.3176 type:complete len:229 (-) Transcript_1393:687-1373(-)